MPVYNAGEYLSVAIESILNQDYTDFEFVIVNDGSTDGSRDRILSYQDPRIIAVDNPANMGLISSLNRGLEICKGDYIVRMDQDDISLPGRISKQIGFMESNPEIGLIGSWFEDFGDGIESRFVRYSSDDVQIRLRHLYQTHISHPTAVIRASIVKKHQLRFDPEFVHGEDYNFWVSMSEYCKLGNYPEILVRKRDHPSNITNKYAETMNATCNRVKRRQFERMGVPVSIREADLYTRFANPEWDFTENEFMELKHLLDKLASANSESIAIPEADFKSYLALKWFHLCYNNKAIRKDANKIWKSLSYHHFYKPSKKHIFLMKLKASRLQA